MSLPAASDQNWEEGNRADLCQANQGIAVD